MEASGHQKIETETWLKPLAEILGIDLEKGNFNSSAIGFDTHVGAIYLGNWISDMSQFVNEDLVNALEISKEVIDNIKKLLKDLITFIKTKSKKIIEKGLSIFQFFDEQISYEWEGKDFSDDIISTAVDKIVEEINCLICALDRIQLESLINNLYVVKLTPPEREARRELIREGIRLFVQLLGYTKFCYQKDSEIYIDKTIYNSIFPKLITSYYPFDHIDRTVDFSRAPVSIPCDFNPKNYYDRRFPYQNDYKFLSNIQESLNLASKRISVFEEQIAIPLLNNVKPKISQSQWHYHLAQLGKGLHIVEDYFAHSTFMANAIIGLMEKDKKNSNEVTHLSNLFLNSYERNKINFSIIGIDSKFKEADKNIFTGFFEKNDMAASFFHLLAGFLQEKLDLPTESYSDVLDKYADGIFRDVPFINVVDDVFDNVIDYFSEKIDEFKNNLLVLNPEAKKIVLLTEFKFTKNQIKNILKSYDSLALYGEDKSIVSDVTNVVNKFLTIVYYSRTGVDLLDKFEKILNLLKALKGFKDLYKIIIKLIQFVRIIKKFSLIIGLVKKNGTLPKIALQLAIDIIKVEAFYHFYDLIEQDIIKSDRIGSHALIAIDEELAKPNLYGATERTAKFINYCIFNNLFKEPRKYDENNNIQPINWETFLNKSLKHPSLYLNLGKFHYDPFEEIAHNLKKGETIATILVKYASTVHPDFRSKFEPAFLGANPSIKYLNQYSALDALLDPFSQQLRIPYQLGNPIFINLKEVKVESDVSPWFEKTINADTLVSFLQPFIETFNNESNKSYKSKTLDQLESEMKKKFDDFEKNRIQSSNDCIIKDLKSMAQKVIDVYNTNIDNSCAVCEKKSKSKSK